MLLILMFHQIYDPNSSQSFGDQQAYFAQYLSDLKKKYPLIRPGEACQNKRLNLCLCFDDAYYDFYKLVFPLLKKFEIPAVLAIPTAAIQTDTNQSSLVRLSQLNINLQNPKTAASLCTWQEIKAMVDSQWVIPASHTHNHLDLQKLSKSRSSEWIHFELQRSQQLIQYHTQHACDTFVYPFGSWNPEIQQIVSKYFLYNFRISHAINSAHWHPREKLFYRVNANPFWQKYQFFSKFQLWQYYLKSWLNLLRKR